MFTQIHGESKTKLYGIWASMKTRCYTPTATSYKWYGKKGIGVCNEWRNDYFAFAKWAKENGYKEGLTLDRINPLENYSPQNCRWITQKEQQNNRTNNHKLTINSETKTLQQWCELYNIDHSTVLMRIKHGWNLEKAITTPIKTKSY